MAKAKRKSGNCQTKEGNAMITDVELIALLKSNAAFDRDCAKRAGGEVSRSSFIWRAEAFDAVADRLEALTKPPISTGPLEDSYGPIASDVQGRAVPERSDNATWNAAIEAAAKVLADLNHDPGEPIRVLLDSIAVEILALKRKPDGEG